MTAGQVEPGHSTQIAICQMTNAGRIPSIMHKPLGAALELSLIPRKGNLDGLSVKHSWNDSEIKIHPY